MSPMGATVDPSSPGSRLDADHPENGVLIPCLITVSGHSVCCLCHPPIMASMRDRRQALFTERLRMTQLGAITSNLTFSTQSGNGTRSGPGGRWLNRAVSGRWWQVALRRRSSIQNGPAVSRCRYGTEVRSGPCARLFRLTRLAWPLPPLVQDIPGHPKADRRVDREAGFSSSRQLVEQRPRLDQIGGVEAFGEPAIY